MTSRIDALMAQMTIEEKVGQLNVTADMVRPFVPDINPVANAQNAEQVLELIRQAGSAPCSTARGATARWRCSGWRWKRAAWASL